VLPSDLIAKQTKGKVFNIGSQNVYSIKQTFDIIQKKLKTKCKIVLDKKRLRPQNSEVFLLSADFKKLKKQTRYKPKYNFNNGINKTVEWYLENKDIIKSSSKYHI
jgi:nucleoside-diphosphate-sugar epimerase